MDPQHLRQLPHFVQKVLKLIRLRDLCAEIKYLIWLLKDIYKLLACWKASVVMVTHILWGQKRGEWGRRNNHFRDWSWRGDRHHFVKHKHSISKEEQQYSQQSLAVQKGMLRYTIHFVFLVFLFTYAYGTWFFFIYKPDLKELFQDP